MYFDMPVASSPYMQYIARCRQPNLTPAICHYDNTSRVQTVNTQDNPNFRAILELWYDKTGCPMLMNTSLNVKGEPLVNSLEDAVRWERINGVKVF
jgi:carbamoyltransferase